MSFTVPTYGLHRLSTLLVDPVHTIALPPLPASISSFVSSDPYFYGAMARAIGPKADTATFRMHLSAMNLLFGQFIDTSHGDIRIDFGGSTRLPLIDFMRNTFTGLIGYGACVLHAIDSGYVWFAHYEDVRDAVLGHGDFPQRHSPYDQITWKKPKKVKKAVPPYRIARPKGRRPDLFCIKQDASLGVLECKATLQVPKKFWDSTIFPAFMEQAEPMLGTSIQGATVSEAMVLCGKFENGAGARMYGLAINLPPTPAPTPPPPPGALVPTVITAHYAQWLKLMGDVFWDLADGLLGPTAPQGTVSPGSTTTVAVPGIGNGIQLICAETPQTGDSKYILALSVGVFEELRAFALVNHPQEKVWVENQNELIPRLYWRPTQEENTIFLQKISSYTNTYARLFRELASSVDDYALFPDGTAVIPRAWIQK